MRSYQDATEPEPNEFTFTQGDQIADYAKTNGQILRGRAYCLFQMISRYLTCSQAIT